MKGFEGILRLVRHAPGTYAYTIGKLVNMIIKPQPWLMLRSNR